MRNKPRIGSLVVLVIPSSVAEGEIAIDGSADYVRVTVILPIVLPPANLAQLEGFRHGQGSVAATEAAGSTRCSHPFSMRRAGAKQGKAPFSLPYYGNLR